MSEITIRRFGFTPDPRRGMYENLVIRAGKRRIEVTVSPTGKSVHVFVDGKRVEENPS